MTDELLFSVKDGTAVPADRISMTQVGLRERQHLQEWVLKHPQILGGDTKIITAEFGRWRTATDVPVSDRLDVLALDRTGRLVVAELKRDKAPDTITMQAINYAAMVRRFSVDTLSEVHASYLGQGTTAEEARQHLLDWSDGLSDESLGPPRIVLLASEFGPTVTNTALFLLESGLDIQLRRYELYMTQAKEMVLSVSQLLPVPDAEEFMVKPRSSSATQAETQVRREQQATLPARLVEAAVIQVKTKLKIVVPMSLQENRDAIVAYLEAQPDRGYVEWTPNKQQPVYWPAEFRSFEINGLVRLIITLATGTPPRSVVHGAQWFRDDKGRTLKDIGNSLPG